MSIFDLFKTQWSSGTITQDDRKKLFWYLKRKTSYTAWRREANAFDRFAEIFEKQVKEEPVVVEGPYTKSWEQSYPEILRAQVLYEQGLERLKNGDRTVWLYNDRGVFDDATTISYYWFSDLVNNRHDHFHAGKYLDEMIKALKEFFKTVSDTGYIQPMMADTPAPEVWNEFMECVLNNEEWPRVISPYTPQEKRRRASSVPPADTLPPVPVMENEVLIRTGEIAPVFGIYEPQFKDGCMNYLLGGVPAPKARLPEGGDRPVLWRLIWEDTRYLDGEIPSEENYYFPSEKKAAPQVMTLVDDLLSTSSGKVCPKTGTWAVMDDLNASLMMKQGEPMPQHDGRDVTWVWVD